PLTFIRGLYHRQSPEISTDGTEMTLTTLLPARNNCEGSQETGKYVTLCLNQFWCVSRRKMRGDIMDYPF
ncbi:hypothetical protein RAG41_23000, partial [Klebsiella pneumoniae]